MPPPTSNMRLTFLYPHLYRSVRRLSSESATTRTARRQVSRNKGQRRTGQLISPSSFSTSGRARQATFERHGKAVGPLPVPPATGAAKLPQPGGGPKGSTTSEGEVNRKDARGDDFVQAQQQKKPQQQRRQKAKAEGAVKGSSAADANSEKKEGDTSPANGENPGESAPGGDNEPNTTRIHTGGPTTTPQQAAAEETMQSAGPMDAVLHMPPPGEMHHPHISTPPYLHHFDSYTLVKQLQAEGYTQVQAITLMKAVRALLARHLETAQEGLVSKSDVDNETYLFRAACSELSTEVVNNRKAADEKSRQQRTVLQHEVDILGQKLNQDLMTLRDDVRGHFNDRKMAVREEQKRMDNAIQQVNFGISVTLTSDAKSEIEGVRWILIRRAVLGIAFMVFLTLFTLRYATYLGQQKHKEMERKKQEEEEAKRNAGRVDNADGPNAAEILAAN
ncbi:hypothetical protein PG990_000893 [Apiospora arundinis]|uniref:MOZ protein represents a chromatin-associated acetyltransferase n=1 Tax=Apiospora arundinis TaxID=335852 RepID=A0ABR2I1L5_9PEZI